MRYTNTSLATKTFYGVKFKPGETHDVPGCINDSKWIRILESPKSSGTAKKSDLTKSNVKSENQGGNVNGTNNNK